MSETFPVGALLAVVGGYLDVYTYIARGGIFANAQTGNIVLLGVSLADGNLMKALSYLISIAAFVLGVFTAELIHKLETKIPLHWRQLIIALEMIVVLIAAFLPVSDNVYYSYNMLCNVVISYICSLQVQTFRVIHGITCATTMCTGNLRSGTDHLMRYHTSKNKSDLKNGLKCYLIILFFFLGAVISVFLTRAFGSFSVIFCLIPLLIVFILMFIRK